MSDIRTARAYLILERPSWKFDPPNIVGMRKSKPDLKGGQIAVRVALNIPMEMFNEFIPEITAQLEAGEVIIPELELEESDDADS